MVNYPSLSQQQQRGLPVLQKPASRIPAQFSDSSHQLWFCETVDGPMVLKLCDHANIDQSAFWQGMNSLFSINFPASLGNIAGVYQRISSISPLSIPSLINSMQAQFLLARWLPGDDVEPSAITPLTIKSLANHLGLMHQQQHPQWGSLQQPEFTAIDWPLRLKKTLQQQADSIEQTVLQQALKQAEQLSENTFVPIMPDLRWDQFLMQQGKLSALVDLDAIVYGPKTLEFVLLEYLLDQSQAEQFAAEYQNNQVIPDLTDVRLPYRLLLFLMNVLGETDLNSWLNHPERFG
ncbi:MAG: phosphotransferase [Methylophaga sp.]|uniref:phosphotransferase n=1 Tax=Methylophaga sp. TaxID=2024840 RepID=UPI000C10D0B4|nr:phosphotransferase [Methylophaga sp.]MBL1458080.1 phosphotransferase [Methylophaga sp.]